MIYKRYSKSDPQLLPKSDPQLLTKNLPKNVIQKRQNLYFFMNFFNQKLGITSNNLLLLLFNNLRLTTSCRLLPL